MVYLKPLYSRLDRLAVNYLRKPSKIMSKYYLSKCYIFLSKKFRTEKILSYIIIQYRRRPQKQWWSSKNTAIDFKSM